LTTRTSGYQADVDPDPHLWTPPATVRALLWWPLLSLLLVSVAPDSAAWTIAVTGAALAVTGCLAGAFVHRARPAPLLPLLEVETNQAARPPESLAPRRAA